MTKRESPNQAQNRFYEDLLREDEVGVVVRAHIHIEQHLNLCIDELVPYPDALRPMELDYFQRVHLLVALGLKEELKGPLLALGKLRNDFAHRLDAVLTEGRVNNFYQTFSGDDKDIIQKSLDHARKKLRLGAKGKMKHKTSQDRFILYAVTIRTALLAALREAKESVAEDK